MPGFRCPRRLLLLAGLLAFHLAAFAQSGDRPNEVQAPPPTHLEIPPSPVLLAEDALKSLQVAPGYQVEIAAADPLLGDPVAATFGPDGRLWVVEMRGFMPDPDGTGEEARVGMVAALEDTDGDGRMDKRTVFLDGLVLPRALALVGDGVLVAEPPNLWFCRDTDGDGRADEKKLIASDYGAAGNPEHTANGLYRALDNWIYSANHNVRFRYRGNGNFDREFTIMRGQWGISQDDAGRLFYNTNSDPLRYDAVASHYFARNPALTDPTGLNLQVVPFDLPVWPLRVTPGINRGYQSLDATGRMTAVTAACAPLVLRGDLAPGLRGDVFLCEPSGNLVKRIVLDSAMDPLTGRNAHEGSEFLASTDERFRPVNLCEGPDGALYVVDMYRGIIQHRIYLTTYLRRQIEDRGLAEGMGMGRVYRVLPAGAQVKRTAFNLAAETTEQLVARLASPGGWWRDTAQRLLVERSDPAAVPLLRQLALDAQAPSFARLHALWTLEGINGLDVDTLLRMTGDANDDLAIAAIRLSEKFLATDDPEVFAHLSRLDHGNVYRRVVQQCFTLGEYKSAAALPVLLKIGRRWPQPLIADAIVSGLAGRELDFVRLALETPEQDSPSVVLAAAAAWRSEDPETLRQLDELLGQPDAGSLLMASLDKVVPPATDGQRPSFRLSARPQALERLAARSSSPRHDRAVSILSHLRWPGHEAEQVVVTPLSPSEQQLFEKGRTIYDTICTGCHQPNGQGLKGLAPALAGSKWVAGDERALARIVLHGKTREGSIMPPLESLDDESLAGALTFVRRSWGHHFAAVAPSLIARTREETAGRAEPWTEKDLAKYLEQHRIDPENP